MKPDPKKVGKRIRSLRKEKGLTMQEFGNFIDKANKSAVGNWERGDNLPNNSRLKMIAQFGGISMNELLYGDFESFCYDVFDEVNASEGYDSDLAYKEITNPNNKRAFYAKVFNYVKEYKYDYEDYDRISNLYKKSIADEVRGADYSNEGSFNYLHVELEKLKWGLRNYYYTPLVVKDNSDAAPGDRVTIAHGNTPREGADFELYKKQENIISKAKIQLIDLEMEYKERIQ